MIYNFGDVLEYYSPRYEMNLKMFYLGRWSRYIVGVNFYALDNFDKQKILYLIGKGSISQESQMTKQLDDVKEKIESIRNNKILPDRFYNVYLKNLFNRYTKDLLMMEKSNEMINVKKSSVH